MTWETYKVEEQRLKLITAYAQGDFTMTALCDHYGISRKTGYKWYQRFLSMGVEGLHDQSRATHTPNHLYGEEQINTALNLKRKHLTWGPKKILVKLETMYPAENWPSPTRLYEIFKDYHLVTSRRIRQKLPATAPLGDLTACNDTWAMDFKGWFLTGDGHKCEPLTITDSFTRYLIRCVHLDTHSVEYVWPVFEAAFLEYGLPTRVRSDNGPPFGSLGVGRLTRLSVNLIKAGVMPEWIRPGHPEDNGRHERFHLTLKQDVASPPKNSLPLQIQAMNHFQQEYNFERPHEALNMETPGSCYHPSRRSWNGILKPPEYDIKESIVRKVCQNGTIWLKQKEFYVGKALIGEYVGLKNSLNGELELYFGPVYLGKLREGGLDRPKLETRKRS